MENRPRVSDAEWEVMKVLWERSPRTANEVVNALSEKRAWKPKTVRTLINRLAGKGAIGFEKQGRGYLYSPVLSEEDCLRQETKSFIKRAGTGALKPMLAAFIEDEELSAAEIAELKRILEEK